MFLEKDGYNCLFRFGSLSRIPGLTHAVASRIGGHSQAPFDGLNTSIGVGDDPAAVRTNRRRLRQMTGGIHVYTRQNHGTSIHVVTRDNLPPGEAIVTTKPAADALITDLPGVCLLIQTADCQAVMLADPCRRVVANVHSGWRGSIFDIIGKTVGRMVTEFGCRPADMVAAIGPSLGPCCAEFVNYEQEIPRPLWPFRVGPYHFDFWKISRYQLVRAGLAPDKVTGSGICTRCNSHLFFSYRNRRKTGRFAALIGWDQPSECPCGKE